MLYIEILSLEKMKNIDYITWYIYHYYSNCPIELIKYMKQNNIPWMDTIIKIMSPPRSLAPAAT